MATYPYYENQHYVEKNGQWVKLEWLNEAHRRFYFPDKTGQLKLIAINNYAEIDYRVLDEATLCKEFDVTYRDLDFYISYGVQTVASLDDQCTWPAALYPNGRPWHTPQQEKLPDLAGLPLHARFDAWI